MCTRSCWIASRSGERPPRTLRVPCGGSRMNVAVRVVYIPFLSLFLLIFIFLFYTAPFSCSKKSCNLTYYPAPRRHDQRSGITGLAGLRRFRGQTPPSLRVATGACVEVASTLREVKTSSIHWKISVPVSFGFLKFWKVKSYLFTVHVLLLYKQSLR